MFIQLYCTWNAGILADPAVASGSRPSVEADASTADAGAVAGAELAVDPVAREVVALAILSANHLRWIGTLLALAFATNTFASFAAQDAGSVVRFALRFQLVDLGSAGTFAVMSTVQGIAMTDSALQIAPVAALVRIGHEILSRAVFLIPFCSTLFNPSLTGLSGFSHGQSQTTSKARVITSLTPTG